MYERLIRLGSLEVGSSLGFGGSGTEDADHEVCQSASAVHNAGFADSFGFVLVSLIDSAVKLEVIVDRVDGVSVSFGSPLLEVSIVKLSDINGVSRHNSGSSGTVGGPSGSGERQNGVPCELVTNRVPNGVEGADAVNDRAHVLV